LLRRSCTSGIATDRCASLLARWKDSTPRFMTEGMFAIGMMQWNSLIFITNGPLGNEGSSPLAPPRRVLGMQPGHASSSISTAWLASRKMQDPDRQMGITWP